MPHKIRLDLAVSPDPRLMLGVVRKASLDAIRDWEFRHNRFPERRCRRCNGTHQTAHCPRREWDND